MSLIFGFERLHYFKEEKLDKKWFIVCGWINRFLITSIMIERRENTGKVLVSGELKISTATGYVWERKFSQYISNGSSHLQ